MIRPETTARFTSARLLSFTSIICAGVFEGDSPFPARREKRHAWRSRARYVVSAEIRPAPGPSRRRRAGRRVVAPSSGAQGEGERPHETRGHLHRTCRAPENTCISVNRRGTTGRPMRVPHDASGARPRRPGRMGNVASRDALDEPAASRSPVPTPPSRVSKLVQRAGPLLNCCTFVPLVTNPCAGSFSLVAGFTGSNPTTHDNRRYVELTNARPRCLFLPVRAALPAPQGSRIQGCAPPKAATQLAG